jgi:hypothetical protein
MKRALQIGFTVLALIAIPSLGAFAATPAEPAPTVTLDMIFAAPADTTNPMELSPAETAIFMDDEVSRAAVEVCCRGALAVCVSSCGGDVESFTCGPDPDGGSGCSSDCDC